MSEREQSESQVAFAELDQLVRHLGEELAGFRRRALQAEARVRELEAEGGEAPTTGATARKLAADNARLTERLETAGAQAKQLLDRVRFLRQQHTRGGER